MDSSRTPPQAPYSPHSARFVPPSYPSSLFLLAFFSASEGLFPSPFFCRGLGRDLSSTYLFVLFFPLSLLRLLWHSSTFRAANFRPSPLVFLAPTFWLYYHLTQWPRARVPPPFRSFQPRADISPRPLWRPAGLSLSTRWLWRPPSFPTPFWSSHSFFSPPPVRKFHLLFPSPRRVVPPCSLLTSTWLDNLVSSRLSLPCICLAFNFSQTVSRTWPRGLAQKRVNAQRDSIFLPVFSVTPPLCTRVVFSICDRQLPSPSSSFLATFFSNPFTRFAWTS